MMADDIAFLSISEAAQRIDAGTLSPVAIMEACLARIATHDGHVHSFLHCDGSGALEAARRAERTIAENGRRNALEGLPVGIKDLFGTQGMPTTYNSRAYAGETPTDDAVAVARLRQQGAVVLGKLSAWECGMGGTSFDLPWPPARNPWALERDPGGSSTGAGVAVAAGFCFGAIGSDTGGSIREPAAWCGIAGLKPTYGLVPCEGGLAASFSLDHAGPMARTVEDCAHLLGALAGGAPDAFARGISGGVAGLSVGVVRLGDDEEADLDPAVAQTVEKAAATLGQLGARLSEVRLPALQLFSAVVTVIASAEGYALHRERLHRAGHLYDPLTLQRIMAGAVIKAADYVDATRLRSTLSRQVRDVFRECDLLVMPMAYGPAPMLGAFDSHGGHPSLGRPWNVTGSPALSVRSGFTENGLPLAVQIVGRPFEDALVLRAGHALETALGYGSRRPEFIGQSTPRPVQGVSSGADEDEALRRATRDAINTVRTAVMPASAPAHGFSPLIG